MHSKQIKRLCAALNAANDAIRAELAEYGITTNENAFDVTENKKLLRKLYKAQSDYFSFGFLKETLPQ